MLADQCVCKSLEADPEINSLDATTALDWTAKLTLEQNSRASLVVQFTADNIWYVTDRAEQNLLSSCFYVPINLAGII